jgi:hypothetical protein
MSDGYQYEERRVLLRHVSNAAYARGRRGRASIREEEEEEEATIALNVSTINKRCMTRRCTRLYRPRVRHFGGTCPHSTKMPDTLVSPTSIVQAHTSAKGR